MLVVVRQPFDGFHTLLLGDVVGRQIVHPSKAQQVFFRRLKPTIGLISHRNGEHFDLGPETVAAIERARRAGRRVAAVGTTVLRTLESAADAAGRLVPAAGETRLFITPGFRFRVVDRLLTNFHLPRSTLFMLVAAFAGLARMQAAYAHAIAQGYRFYSYGDACLLERAEAPG